MGLASEHCLEWAALFQMWSWQGCQGANEKGKKQNQNKKKHTKNPQKNLKTHEKNPPPSPQTKQNHQQKGKEKKKGRGSVAR